MIPKTNPRPEKDQAEDTVTEKGIEVTPCSVDEVERHLRAFIAAFIQPNVRPRWLEFLIDKRSEWNTTRSGPHSLKIRRKANDVLRMFAAEGKYCVRVPNGQRTAAYYEATFGKAPGVYFALGTPPCKLTAVEADAKFGWEDESAILSFQAGKKALSFCHDGGAWKCDKE